MTSLEIKTSFTGSSATLKKCIEDLHIICSKEGTFDQFSSEGNGRKWAEISRGIPTMPWRNE